jgi:hypothetical protein
VLGHEQRRSASKVWVRLGEDDLARLDGSSVVGPMLPRLEQVMCREGLSRDEVWDQVRQGAYRAFRVAHGSCWAWHLQRLNAPTQPRDHVRRRGEGVPQYE